MARKLTLKKHNARINEQSLAGGFFAAQREKGDR
jgi:hypothetical protein